ncbi:uncharacterized protein V6R79_008717 [Siganus canaliculatus]
MSEKETQKIEMQRFKKWKKRIYRMRGRKERAARPVRSMQFDSVNALLSCKKMFSSVWFTYCQYSVDNLNGFNSLSINKMVLEGFQQNSSTRMERRRIRLTV